MKLSFPAKRKFKLRTVWQVLTSKLEINFFFHTRRKVQFQKCLLQKLDLHSFPNFHCDQAFVNIFVECFENISGGFLIYHVLIFCSIIETVNFDSFINCTIYIESHSSKTVCFMCTVNIRIILS